MNKYTVYYDEDFKIKLLSYIELYKAYPDYLNKFKIEMNKFVEDIASNPQRFTPLKKQIRKAILINIKTNIYFVLDEDNKTVYVYEIRNFKQNQKDVLQIK